MVSGDFVRTAKARKPRRHFVTSRGAEFGDLSFNTIEYAVRDMFKGRSLTTAAKRTAEKFSGHENWALGSGVIHIDVDDLEEALWNRMVEKVIEGVKRNNPGYEHYALDGTLQFYRQNAKLRAELKERVIERLGGIDPFGRDDAG